MLKLLKAYVCKYLPFCFDSEECLEGRWKSSLELTQKNNDFSTLPTNQREFFEQALGELVIDYHNDYFCEESPDKKLTISNKVYDWHGAKNKNRVPYKTIRIDSTDLYIVSKNPYGMGWFINRMSFVSEHIYKVRSHGIEEYFTRQ